jgi:arsenate reductase
MPDHPMNVLFLCTGNSARSIMAEALLNRLGAGRFRAYSAGSKPKGAVHPQAIKLLNDLGCETAHLRSKSWDEFATPNAPHLDLIFTVCDNAAAEACPVWPGHPTTAHWGIPDPAAAQGTSTEIETAFREAVARLFRRISALVALRVETLHGAALEAGLREIGHIEEPAKKDAPTR